MASRVNNNYYINAPAGSGKTFYIKEKINEILSIDPSSRILCITYTNRAADEMKKRIISDKVEISTIHSFMQRFLKPFMALEKTIRFYTNTYWEEICNKYEEKQEQYNKKYNIEDGQFTKEIFISKLNNIYYGETNYNRWLQGGLSHDCLLEFGYSMIKEFKVIRLKLKELYNYIFIDEVQDTTTQILNFFYETNKDSGTTLYYIGDKMQEVFDNYNGGFEDKFNEMNKSEIVKFDKNYRSSNEIVNVLENIYLSDNKPDQESERKINGIQPKIILCDSIDKFFEGNYSKYETFLKLRTNNRMIFKRNENDLEELFDICSKIYGYTSKYRPTEILLPGNENSKDDVINFVYLISQLVNDFNEFEYGRVIQAIRNTRFKYGEKNGYIFNREKLKIVINSDKAVYKENIKKVVDKYKTTNIDDTLWDFVEYLRHEEIITKQYYQFLVNHCDENSEITYRDNVKHYEKLFNVSISKFTYLCHLNNNKNTSTQHGVKGEGHSKILFVAEDSTKSPRIDMKRFFKMFSLLDNVNFDYLQNLTYEYNDSLKEFLSELGISKYNEIKKNHIEEYSELPPVK